MNPALIFCGLALAGLCGWNAFVLLRNGEAVGRRGRLVSKLSDPEGFWRRAGANLVFAGCGLIVAVIGLFHA